jgi:TolB protein
MIHSLIRKYATDFARVKGWLFLIIGVMYTLSVSAQSAPENNVLKYFSGNQQYPSWSTDGRYLAFQSDHAGNEDIYLYDMQRNIVIQVTHMSTNEEHPVWFPGKDAVVYDSKRNGKYALYYFDLKMGKEVPLFKRNIQAREASFSTKKQLVVFSGLTPFKDVWGVYSYDFLYKNLNTLIQNQSMAAFPEFSPDGKRLVYQAEDVMHRKNWYIANWYGGDNIKMTQGVGKASWGRDSWRLYYAHRDGYRWALFSVCRDGSQLKRVAIFNTPVATPVVSPDGKRLSFAQKTEKGWKIEFLNLK